MISQNDPLFLWKKKNHIEINGSAYLGDKISICTEGNLFAIGDIKTKNDTGKIFVFKKNSFDSKESNSTTTTTYPHSSIFKKHKTNQISISDKIFEEFKPYDSVKKNLARKEIFSLTGEVEEEFLGHAFEVSGNGKMFITGEPYFNNCIGRIRLFDIVSDESYVVEGGSADEECLYFGWDVGINYDGSIIGIITNDDMKGNLKIFKKNQETNNYEELQTVNDEFFTPLSLKFSSDGNILAICEKLKNSNSKVLTEGRIRFLKYDEERNKYFEFGSHPISGSKLDGLNCLYNFALNKEGNIIITSENFYSTHDKKNRGRVRVFSYDSSIENWNLIGNEFLGENENDFCGSSVDINDEGDLIVFSERNFTVKGEKSLNKINCGRVRTFKYNREKNIWEQAGQSIEGEFEGSFPPRHWR